MENFSKLRQNSAITETNNIIDNTNKMKNFFHQDDREITWIIDTHHKWQHSQWKALGEIWHKITPTMRLIGRKDLLNKEKMMDLKYLILDNIWIMKHEGNCQEWHNPISKDKIERIALRNARWRILELPKTKHVLSTMFTFEYSFTGHNFERNLEEQLKNEKNPWRSTM